MQAISPDSKSKLDQALDRKGLRATRQREFVYNVLLSQRDHPTADEVFARVRTRVPGISLATVYNCLDTLVDCELVNKLNYEREPSRFCPRDEGEHAHFLDESTGKVFDIPLPATALTQLTKYLPKGYDARRVKLTFMGKKAQNGAS